MQIFRMVGIYLHRGFPNNRELSKLAGGHLRKSECLPGQYNMCVQLLFSLV